MKIGSILATGAIVLASGIAGWAVGDLMPKGDGAGAAKRAAQAVTVAVRPVENRPYNPPERFVAHAEPVQEVDLLPQVDGYVKEVRFAEGDLVKTDQLLYVLDDEKYRAVVNQCKADLGAAKADLEAAQAETRRTTRYWERMQKADERGITQKERDDAEAEAEKARADESRTAAAVTQAEARLVTAEYDLKKTRIHAPIAGQIGKTAAHVAGARSRNHLGTTEFWGMAASVAFGILLVPGLYALFQTLREKIKGTAKMI